MRHPAVILAAHQRGDSLSDDELRALHVRMQNMADSSSEFGPLFELQRAFCQRIADDCRRLTMHREKHFDREPAKREVRI